MGFKVQGRGLRVEGRGSRVEGVGLITSPGAGRGLLESEGLARLFDVLVVLDLVDLVSFRVWAEVGMLQLACWLAS